MYSRSSAAARRSIRLPKQASTISQLRYVHRPVSLIQHVPTVSGFKFQQPTTTFNRYFSTAKKVVPIQLFDIGEGIAEVELMQWFVAVGDTINQFDNVCEVQSDKATVEISSRYHGVIKAIHYEVGNMIDVGSTLVDIEVEDDGSITAEAVPATEKTEEASAAPAASSATTPTSSSPAQIAQSLKDVLTTPAVRKIAKENAVDLAQVPGTGPNGRILKSDILNFINGDVSPVVANGDVSVCVATASAPGNAAAANAAMNAATTAATAAIEQLKPLSPISIPPAESKTVPISGIQRAMVRSMNESLKIPHFTFCEEVHMDALSEIRGPINQLAAQSGLKLSYLPFIIKALSVALHEFPVLNATITKDEANIIYHGDHNIGVAIDTPRGLLVPSIKQCQHKSLFEIAQELKNLQVLGAAGKLGESHLTGTTITVSNMGSIGGTTLSPVIMAPQVTIVALGRIREKCVLDATSGDVEAVKYMNASWAGDHRIIDGATMARFVNVWKSYLENPSLLLTRLK